MRIGCQTYTWEMLENAWTGTPDDILDAAARAGYAGIEFSNVMIGRYWDHPDDFARALDQRRLACPAFAYATTGFTESDRYQSDLAGADRALRFAARFGAVLGLGGPSSHSRDHYDHKLDQACRFYAEVARRGRDLGVTVAVHPHSHHTSLALSAAEYDRLLAATADAGLMFNPDTGHILRGGHDPLDCLKRHRRRIVHIHMKDVDAQDRWQPMGAGITDTASILRWLNEIGYPGWLVIEEESDGARSNPAGAVADNRAYLKSLGV
jgi:sugar phosphate isomerase/epimerase